MFRRASVQINPLLGFVKQEQDLVGLETGNAGEVPVRELRGTGKPGSR
jgi:hypothetical protein